MMVIDLEDFRAWLEASNGYAERTVQQTLMSTEGFLRKLNEGKKPAPSAWMLARRIQRYAIENDLPWASEPALTAAAGTEAQAMASAAGKRRKREARSFDDESWRRLAHVIMESKAREARVLEIMLFTGFRASDALRLERTAIVSGLEYHRFETVVKGGEKQSVVMSGPTDPLYVALERTLAQWKADPDDDHRLARTLAGWIVPDSVARIPIQSSYRAVFRALKGFGEVAGVEGRVHLHRMRRTIAVQALRESKNIVLVGQLLGHKPGSKATMQYLDEARLDDVADLRQSVQNKFLK